MMCLFSVVVLLHDYTSKFIAPSMMGSCPDREAKKQDYIITLPSCFTDGVLCCNQPVAYQVGLHDQALLRTQEAQKHPSHLVYLADLYDRHTRTHHIGMLR